MPPDRFAIGERSNVDYLLFLGFHDRRELYVRLGEANLERPYKPKRKEKSLR